MDSQANLPQAYQVLIYWSDEDQAYIAEVPEPPGAMADGETVIQEWIETARELGRSIPSPQGRLMTIPEAAERLGLRWRWWAGGPLLFHRKTAGAEGGPGLDGAPTRCGTICDLGTPARTEAG